MNSKTAVDTAAAQPSDWREILERIEAKATGGLCQFGLAGKHAFLSDIREIVNNALAATPVAQPSAEPGVYWTWESFYETENDRARWHRVYGDEPPMAKHTHSPIRGVTRLVAGAGAGEPTEPSDPLDAKIPADFKAAGATFRKGLPMRMIAQRIERLWEDAYGPMPSPEQQAGNLAALQGLVGAGEQPSEAPKTQCRAGFCTSTSCNDAEACLDPVTAAGGEPSEAQIDAAMRWLKNFQHMRGTDKREAVREAIRAALAPIPGEPK